jgi:hypothetical protein
LTTQPHRGVPRVVDTYDSWLIAKGSTKSAFGIHGLTAMLMVLGAIPMMIGAPRWSMLFNLPICELQRDWNHKATVAEFAKILFPVEGN